MAKDKKTKQTPPSTEGQERQETNYGPGNALLGLFLSAMAESNRRGDDGGDEMEESDFAIHTSKVTKIKIAHLDGLELEIEEKDEESPVDLNGALAETP